MGISAETDVGAIVAAAKAPELVELERQLEETLRSMNVVSSKLPALRDRTNRTLNVGRAIGRLTDEQMAADDLRIAEIEATIGALSKTADDIGRKIAAIKPIFAAAVVERLAPIRAQAANDIQVAVNAFYEAVSLYNRTSEALASVVKRPLVLPVRIPTLDHFVQKLAEDRT